jgi:cytoskeletal protein CcmA (bactofilin family)
MVTSRVGSSVNYSFVGEGSMSLWRKISSVAGAAQREREVGVERVRGDIEEADRRAVSEIARSLVPENLESSDGREGGVPSGVQLSVAGSAPKVEKTIGTLRIAVEPGVRVSGDLYLDEDSQIGGLLQGRVFARRSVKLLKEGAFEGHCEAADLEVYGKFQGGAVCTRSISIRSGADVSGSLRAPLLKVDEGAEIDCNCAVTGSVINV